MQVMYHGMELRTRSAVRRARAGKPCDAQRPPAGVVRGHEEARVSRVATAAGSIATAAAPATVAAAVFASAAPTGRCSPPSVGLRAAAGAVEQVAALAAPGPRGPVHGREARRALSGRRARVEPAHHEEPREGLGPPTARGAQQRRPAVVRPRRDEAEPRDPRRVRYGAVAAFAGAAAVATATAAAAAAAPTASAGTGGGSLHDGT